MIRLLMLMVRILSTLNALGNGTIGRLLIRRRAYRGSGRLIRRIFR